MQNLDVIYVIHIRSHPCRNGWTLQHFHIWSHIHAESGSDGCHICKIHVKYSARAARSLAMHVIKSLPESHLRKFAGENHIQGHIHAESVRKSSHLKSHPNHIRNHIHAESIHFQPPTLLPTSVNRPRNISAFLTLAVLCFCMHVSITCMSTAHACHAYARKTQYGDFKSVPL